MVRSYYTLKNVSIYEAKCILYKKDIFSTTFIINSIYYTLQHM